MEKKTKKKPALSLAVVVALVQKIGEWVVAQVEEVPVGYVTKEFMGAILGIHANKLQKKLDKAFEIILRSRWRNRPQDRSSKEEVSGALELIKNALEIWAALVKECKSTRDRIAKMCAEMGRSGVSLPNPEAMSMVELREVEGRLDALFEEVSVEYTEFQLQRVEVEEAEGAAEAPVVQEPSDVTRAKQAHLFAIRMIDANTMVFDPGRQGRAVVDATMSLESIYAKHKLAEARFDRLVGLVGSRVMVTPGTLPPDQWIDDYRFAVVKAANPVAKTKVASVQVIEEPFVPKKSVEARPALTVEQKVEPERPFEQMSLLEQCRWLERKLERIGNPVSRQKLVTDGMQVKNLERRKLAMLAQVAELERALALAPKLAPLRKRQEAVLALHLKVRRKEMAGDALRAIQIRDAMSEAEIEKVTAYLTQWERTLQHEERHRRGHHKPKPAAPIRVVDEREVAEVGAAIDKRMAVSSPPVASAPVKQDGERRDGNGKRN